MLYSGSMGLKQGLESFVAAARKLAALLDSPLFVLAGDGPARGPLQEQAAAPARDMVSEMQQSGNLTGADMWLRGIVGLQDLRDSVHVAVTVA